MGIAERPADLIDFLYRDRDRITSFYAQMFGGHLVSTEVTETSRDASERKGSAGFKLLSGELKGIRENLLTEKLTTQPHDVATIDVLTWLVKSGRVYGSFQQAPAGTIVRVTGTLILANRSVLNMASALLGSAIKSEPTAQSLSGILAGINLPSVFLIRSDGNTLAGGVIAESGLSEPIAAYFAKHGQGGLPGVELIGVKEGVESFSIDGAPPLFDACLKYAAEMSKLILPPAAIRIAPLAIYRKIAGAPASP